MFGKPHRAYVFGAGPAGLLAAWALKNAGLDTAVFSAPGVYSNGKVQKSDLHGCQYLHAAIPGIDCGEPEKVRYWLHGSVTSYRRKVYGSGWNGNVSPDEYGTEVDHYAWDLRKVYDWLWDWAQREDLLVSSLLGPMNVQRFYNDRSGYVVNTVPQQRLCQKIEEHNFAYTSIWAMGETEDGLTALPYSPLDFTVQCNGYDAPRWYRAARVFGYSTLEWPDGPKPPISGVARVYKPLSTDCDCYTGGKRWLRVGRYGRWTKGVLVHTAYTDVIDKWNLR